MNFKLAIGVSNTPVDGFSFYHSKQFTMKNYNLAKSLLVLSILAGGTGTLAIIQNASADENVEMERHMQDFEQADKKVNKLLENTENGVVITLTTEDSEALEKLQNMTEMPQGPKMEWMEEVDQAFNVLDNGVQITLSSEDSEMVEKLQKLSEMKHVGKGRGHMQNLPFFRENVEHSVEIIDNGVVITLTSEDAEAVEKLQDFNWERK